MKKMTFSMGRRGVDSSMHTRLGSCLSAAHLYMRQPSGGCMHAYSMHTGCMDAYGMHSASMHTCSHQLSRVHPRGIDAYPHPLFTCASPFCHGLPFPSIAGLSENFTFFFQMEPSVPLQGTLTRYETTRHSDTLRNHISSWRLRPLV